MAYRFSGKPRGLLRLVRGKYVALDVPKWRPMGGLVQHEVYINVNHYTLSREGLPGRIRVRMVRSPWRGKPADPTAFRDILLPVGFDDWLETHAVFEYAQRRRPVWWEFRVEQAEATISTRYAKATR